MKKIVLLFLLVISMSLWGKEINGTYSNFLPYSAATMSSDEVIITPNIGGLKGAAWSRDVFDLSKDFHFEYEIYLGVNKTRHVGSAYQDNYTDGNGNIDIGADGIAFVLKSADYKNDHYGRAGEDIGYGGGNFPLSFGVKFDTYTNPRLNDPAYNKATGRLESTTRDHIAFIAKGKISTKNYSGIIGGNAPYKEVEEMEDGRWHKIVLDWNAATEKFTYTFDGIVKDTYSGDIVKEYLGANSSDTKDSENYRKRSKVYFGFTSSTGSWYNEQKLRNPRVKGTIPTGDYKLDIKKEVINERNYKLGEIVEYKITITNPGSDTLFNIKLADAKNIKVEKLGDIDKVASTSDVYLKDKKWTWTKLEPGHSIITTATKTIIQDDINEGSIVRTAVVEARKDSENGEPLYAAAQKTVYPDIVGGLKVSKTIVKGDNYTKVGDIIEYKFNVTNIGNIILKDLSVSDLKIPGVTLDKTILLPPEQGKEEGETATGTGEYIVTQEDVDNGSVVNTANFRAVDPDDKVIGKSSTAVAHADTTLKSEIEIIKTIVSGDNYKKAGDKIVYNFVVTNNGDTTLNGVNITDPLIKGDILLTKDGETTASKSLTMKPGDIARGTGEYTVTQENIDGGEVVNIAKSKGLDPKGTTIEDESTITATGVLTNAIEVLKAIKSGNNYTQAGTKIVYDFTVTNTGNTTLKDVSVLDAKIPTGITLMPTVLAPGATATGTGEYTVTQADVDAGRVENTAMFTVTTPQNVKVTKNSSVTATGVSTNAIEVLKAIKSGNNYTQAGTKIVYDFTVTNTGNTTLKDVSVLDAKIPTGITLMPTVLAPGAVATGTGEYTVTQADVDAGRVENTAMFTVTTPQNVKVTKNSSVTATGVSTNAIEVLKAIKSGNNYTQAGTKIVYDFTVTNTGNTTLKDVSVLDAKIPTGITLTPTILVPGAVATGTGEYTVTQADVDAGKVENTATFTGKDPSGAEVTKDSSVTATGVLTNAIEVLKAIKSGNNYTQAGTKIVYDFTVTNTGNTTLKDVSVLDAKIPTGITLMPTVLAPGAVATGTGEYTVTQADVDAGRVENTAMFTVTTPQNVKVTKNSSVTATGVSTNAIEVLKAIKSGNNYTQAGTKIVYDFTVTNTGNTTLKDVSVLDAKIPTGITLTPTVLVPGAVATGTGEYTVTQADVDAGKVENTATFTGKDPSGAEVTKDSSVTATGVLTNAIEVLKAIKSGNNYTQAGTKIVYDFTVTNTGNITLKDVSVLDAKIPTGITLMPTVLAPGATATGTGEYIVTQADVDAGRVENTAMFTVTTPQNVKVTKNSSVTAIGVVTNEYTVSNTPEIKDGGKVVDKYSRVGDIVTYTVTLKNTGNATLKGIVITDTNNTSGITLDKTTLAPGETATGTVTHTVTQEDLDAGKILNPAHFTAKDSALIALPEKEAPATVTGVIASNLEVHKTIPGTEEFKYTKAGDKITYNFSVKNTGNTTLKDVKVTDPKITAEIVLNKTILAPGETVTGSGEYIVTQADVDAGKVENTATFTVTTPKNEKVTKDSSVTAKGKVTNEYTVSNTPEIKDGGKVVDKYSRVGDMVTYTVTLKNTGNTTLKDVVVTDMNNTTGIKLDKTELAPNETATGTVTHTITQEDLDAGTIVNPAHFTVKDAALVALPKKEATATVNGKTIIDLSIEKTVLDDNGNGKAETDERLKYIITVNNNSNITITDSKLIDTLASRFFRDQNPKNLEVKGTSYQGDLKTGMTLDSIPVDKSVEVTFEMTASYPSDVSPGEKIENTAIISYGKESKNATVDIPVISISSLDLDIKLQVEDLEEMDLKEETG